MKIRWFEVKRQTSKPSHLTPAAADRAVARGSRAPKAERVGLKNFEVCQPRPAAELYR